MEFLPRLHVAKRLKVRGAGHTLAPSCEIPPCAGTGITRLTMNPALGDLLQQRRSEQFVGRKTELARLLECLRPGGPVVAHVHGIAGIGKTTLLARFADLAEAG